MLLLGNSTPELSAAPKIRNIRRPMARVLTAAAFISFCISAYLFQPSRTTDLLDEALWIMLAGGITFWIALFLNRIRRVPQPELSPLSTEDGLTSRSNLLLVILGTLALLALIEVNTGIFGIATLQNASTHIQFVLFIAGLILITLGLFGTSFPLRRKATRSLSFTQHSGLRTQYLFHPGFALLAITLLAYAVRAWGLGYAVHHFIDEIHFSNAVNSLRSPDNPIKLLWPINTITAFPWLFSYVQAWGVSLLGRNLEGLRLISAVIGTLGIPAVYALAKELFDRKTALLAAFLLAVFPPHMQFSRIGLNNIVDPLFGTLALTFLLRGLKYNRRADFVIAGVSLGLTQYFYEGGRLLYPALTLLTLAGFILVKPRFVQTKPVVPTTDNNPSSLSTQYSVLRASLIPFFVAAILVALPVYTTIFATRKPFDPRFQTVGIGGSYWIRVTQVGTPQTLEQHLFLPFLVYVYQPEIALYYGGEQAMLLPYVVPFVMLAAFALLAYWRTPGIVIVLWVLLGSAGNMLLTESAIYARYVVVFPALAILAALGIRTLIAMLWPGKGRWRNAWIITLAVVLGIGQITYFFGPHLGRYNDQIRQTFDSEDAMFRSAAFPWGTQIHVLSKDAPGQAYLSGVLNYVADGLTVFVLPPADFTPAYASGLSKSVDQAFFVEPFDTATVDLLKQYFTLEGPFTSPYNLPSYRQLNLYYARALTSNQAIG
jgi:4-amino-4-deoxy-L-arabinose transferase-like glycosyltransferase